MITDFTKLIPVGIKFQMQMPKTPYNEISFELKMVRRANEIHLKWLNTRPKYFVTRKRKVVYKPR